MNLTPGVTLGVAGVFFKILSELVKIDSVKIFLFVDPSSFESYREKFAELYSVHVLDDFEKTSEGVIWDIEFSPHHFQVPLSSDIPKFVICHDFHVYDIGWKYPRNEEVRRFLLENLRNYDLIFAIFPRTEAFLRKLKFQKEKIKLLESPCIFPSNIERYQNVSLERKWEEIRILYPAQLQQHKNHINLFRAIRLISNRGIKVRLYCPGSTFKSYITDNLKEFVKRAKLDGVCELLGYVSDEELESLYAESDIVVSPSLAEGGAYLFQEALVFNKPFCSSDFEQVRSHVSRLEGNCIFFDPFSPEGIADAILKAFEKRNELREKNVEARELIYSWKWSSVAKKILENMKKTYRYV